MSGGRFYSFGRRPFAGPTAERHRRRNFRAHQDSSKPWTLFSSDPDDLDVLIEVQAFMRRAKGYPLTEAEAHALLRVRRVAPTLNFFSALQVARWYRAQPELRADIEFFLGRRPWMSTAHLVAWEEAVEERVVKHVDLMEGLVDWSASVDAVEVSDHELVAKVDERRAKKKPAERK